ncbi:MAG: nitroreductase family protein [Chloroflexi bacterium]|nr:nitroreductase family protein [Chloroflexota bacterium]
MDVHEAVRTRLTVRQFKPDPVPDEVVHKLLEAGRLAPSSQNLQPWHFIVIRNRETLQRLGQIASSGKFVADAPMAIAIVMDNADRPDLDAGRTLQQMELVAWEEGLGTCFVGLRVAEQNRQVKELLGIPDNLVLITLLPFGYRPDNVTGAGGVRSRKALSEIAHSERFGNAFDL